MQVKNQDKDFHHALKVIDEVCIGCAHCMIVCRTQAIRIREGKGTRIDDWFLFNHIDRQPMGDISGVVKILIVANPKIEFLFEYETDKGVYRIDTREIKEVFSIKELTDNNLMDDIRGMIQENLKKIGMKG
jgi:Fe-S-cluster-containing hydrogenase component 2